MALNSVVGALVLNVAEITCPKNIPSPKKLALGPCCLVTYSIEDISFLEHAVLLQRVFSALEVVLAADELW